MTAMQTIPTTPLEHPSMDFAALRAEGIRLLERLAGGAWTDFNTHDPGITLLEQLCYAMTELGYRTEHPMPDLLAGDEDPYRSLFGPSRALTTEPVTLGDLRRLVLDVKGVRNAWVELIDAPSPALVYHEGKKELRLDMKDVGAPVDRYATPVSLRGLYRVLIAPSSVTEIGGDKLRRDVTERLHAHRPLCSDFGEITVLLPEEIKVVASVEIAPTKAPAALLGQIYDVLSAHIEPVARFSTLGEMVAAGEPMDAIFEGPRLEHGFLKAEELARLEKRDALHTSDMLHALMDISGVLAVHDIKIAISGNSPLEPWTLRLSPTKAPRFDHKASTITLLRDGIEIVLGDATKASVGDEHDQRKKADALPPELTAADRDRIPPAGRERSLARYTSVLHLLPDCYGVGAMGLQSSAPPERIAAQRQLRAYLLFFDQLLCNSFGQLGHARELLSFYGEIRKTYASPIVEDASLDIDALRQYGRDAHASWLEAHLSDPARSSSSIERSNQFLDHLLARFAETHAQYEPHLPAGGEPYGAPGEPQREALARDKQAFLRSYPRISAARGAGFNLTLPTGPENRSGLEERIRLKLGLDAAQNEAFLLIEHILLRPIGEDENQFVKGEIRPIPLLGAASARDPYSSKVSFVFRSGEGRFKDAAFQDLVKQTVRSETPAHLVPYVYWLPDSEWQKLAAAHDEWLSWYRAYRFENLGL